MGLYIAIKVKLNYLKQMLILDENFWTFRIYILKRLGLQKSFICVP